MNFYLSNEHRKYMGLKLIMPNYELVKIKNGENKEFYLFFDKNRIVKLIHYFISDKSISMTERDVNYETIENKSIVLPKTSRGKERELTGSVVESLEGEGNYFAIFKNKEDEFGHAIIGNYTTQKSFYEDNYIEECENLNDIKKWCDKFVNESTRERFIRSTRIQ